MVGYAVDADRMHTRRHKMNRRSVPSVSATIALGVVLFGITAGTIARAAEIRLFCAVALHPAIDALIPGFEKSSGQKVAVTYETAGAVADRVQKGEAADIVINSVPMIDRLQAQGKVVAGSRVIIAKVGVGAFVRKGALKPDISSADAFKRSMLAARSIAYPDPARGGASGIYVASLLERLGVAAEMKPKAKLSTLGTLYASVANGEVEIGFNQSAKSWLNQRSNSLARCRQRFRTTRSSSLASLPAAINPTPQEHWSRSFPRLPPRPF
jgi:molybdate transport system substrate-binding protein